MRHRHPLDQVVLGRGEEHHGDDVRVRGHETLVGSGKPQEVTGQWSLTRHLCCLIWTLMPHATAPATTAAATAASGRSHPAFAGTARTTQAWVLRAHSLIDRLEAWAHGSRIRSLSCRAFVTLVGPLVVLAGVAMTVLPGPGLVVGALGLALLALEYEWARAALRLMGRVLTRARE